MIRTLRIQNFKALKDVRIALTPIHLLIGPNDSGKTSILEAVNTLSRSVRHPSDQVFPGTWKGKELVWIGSDRPSLSLACDLVDADGDFTYSLEYEFGVNGAV